MSEPTGTLFPDLPETLTDEQAEQLRKALTRHHQERVATVSEYCRSLMEWVRIMGESGYATHVQTAWDSVYITLIKSNLAARLVYGGEEVRKEPCPIHKGKWSGCKWGEEACPEGCMYGSNVTGWLPESHAFKPWDDDYLAQEQRDAFKYEPTTRCSVCNGIATAQVHQVAE